MPALRAYRLSAAEAISAGSAPRTGCGLRVQRWLSGTRLPRAVSLGLGGPARTRQRGLTVGDHVILQLGERRTTVTIVGETLSGGGGSAESFADWQTLNLLAPDYQFVNHNVFYQV